MSITRILTLNYPTDHLSDPRSERNFDSLEADSKYASYVDEFAPRANRKDRRKRKPRQAPPTVHTQPQEAEVLADVDGLEGGFKTTYQPSKYETGWLLQSLEPLYNQSFITDVLALVKGGKEASVYRCEAHESTGADLLAAKVYRPRMFRQLRNDHAYRLGREVILSDGTRLNGNDFRETRAIAKGTNYGRKLQHTSWLMYEMSTLKTLLEAGAAVPKPWAAGDNVILMDYIGGEDMAAPTLNTVRLRRGEARPLFEEVMRNVELLLKLGLAHGDLSAYNILYWEGTITLIDFPQVTDIHSNPNAYTILHRDLTRICEYFEGQGYRRDAGDLMASLWRRYAGLTPLERAERDAPFLEAEQEEATRAADLD